MKILCVSDQIDPLVYSSSVKNRFTDVELILSAGDLPLDYLDFIVTNLNKPLLFVFGNHHAEEKTNSDTGAFGSTHLDSKIRTEAGLIIAGLGGSMRYNQGPNQFTERQMYFEIAKLIPSMIINRLFRGRFLDILLTHAPPFGATLGFWSEYWTNQVLLIKFSFAALARDGRNKKSSTHIGSRPIRKFLAAA